MNRRFLLLGGVAAAAAAGGAGLALWHTRTTAGAVPDALWRHAFDRPEGGAPLTLAQMHGKPLLLNFWATWCPPCVTEMPLLDRFQRDQRARGWQVVGLAVDQVDPVRAFLGKHPVSYPIGLAGMDGVDLSRQLGNASGALPFSIVFDASGTVVDRRLGVLSEADLARWVAEVR